MPAFFDHFRQRIISATYPQDQGNSKENPQSHGAIDNLVALGVLLWEVAQADEKFLPEEMTKIEEVLNIYGRISKEDMPIVLRAVEEASINRIDLYSFTSEVGGDLSFQAKIDILENLFRIACADKDLGHEEHEMIRKISGLLKVEHKDFIDAKIKVKKDFRLDTAGL